MVVRGGMVVDGTGSQRRRADVIVRDGRVAAVGKTDRATLEESEVIDADGLIVAPGIVDVHTHYDPALTFEPVASMSAYHGVTTVLAGNCGFSIAPTRPHDQQFVKHLFAKVEQMESSAMDAVDFNFATFGEYLDHLDGRIDGGDIM